MSKGHRQINVRVSVEDDNLVREMEGSWTEILRIGFEKWASEYPDFLMKKTQEYKELYSKCIAIQGNLYKNAIQKNNVLDELYEIYIAQGRSFTNPTAEDRNWLSARLSKMDNGHRISVGSFFKYCEKRFNQDKQKKLEVSDEQD